MDNQTITDPNTQANFVYVEPNSHRWYSIGMLLNNLTYEIHSPKSKEDLLNYLIKGLQNTLLDGYDLRKSVGDGSSNC